MNINGQNIEIDSRAEDPEFTNGTWTTPTGQVRYIGSEYDLPVVMTEVRARLKEEQ